MSMQPLFGGEFTAIASAYVLLGLIAGLVIGREIRPVKKPQESRSKRGGQSNKRRPANASNGNRRAAPAVDDDGGSELYVGNLPYDVTEADLRKLFERFGRVVSVRLIENRQNGKSKGFGFVEMSDPGKASRAIKDVHGTEYEGRALVVNAAKSKARR